jgi:hypothetical protein
MGEMLPLFPLGAVLYPGMLLPLHIFEERYRRLVRDLLDGPESRRFGVIAIRKGRETGVDGVQSLYEIGCTAVLRRVDQHEDGRYDIVAVGAERFRLLGLDQTRPYLQGEVEILAEEQADPAAGSRTCPANRSCSPSSSPPRWSSTCRNGRRCWPSLTPCAGWPWNAPCCPGRPPCCVPPRPGLLLTSGTRRTVRISRIRSGWKTRT